MKQEWWRQEDAFKIHQGESDGQQITMIFHRETDIGPEVAVVYVSDGEGLDNVLGGVVLQGRHVTEIPAD